MDYATTREFSSVLYVTEYDIYIAHQKFYKNLY